MDAKQLDKKLTALTAKTQRLSEQVAYAKGRNPVIFSEYPKADPDIRIPVPFAKKAISLYSGYMAKPGNVIYQGDFFDDYLKPIYFANDEELISAQEFETALTHGAVYELHWTSDMGGNKMFYPVPIDQGLPIYSDDLKPELIGFIWYRKNDGGELANYYDDSIVQEWVKTKDDKEWKLETEYRHGYGQVPVNVGKIAYDGSNLFDHVLPLIDLYDQLASGEVANEAARYNNALLLLADRIDNVTTDPDTGKTAVDRLKELRLLDGMGDPVSNKASYLIKDIPVAFIQYAMETIERLIYETLPIFNPNDDSFASASGVAQKYKLLAFEYKASQIEIYWSKFLQNRIQLLAGIKAGLGEGEDENAVQITFNRNLPSNLAELAQVAATLKGILSDETILRLFPASVIPDVEEELEKIAESAPELTMEMGVKTPVKKDQPEDDQAE